MVGSGYSSEENRGWGEYGVSQGADVSSTPRQKRRKDFRSSGAKIRSGACSTAKHEQASNFALPFAISHLPSLLITQSRKHVSPRRKLRIRYGRALPRVHPVSAHV